MKKITFRAVANPTPGNSLKDLLVAVTTNSPQKALNPEEMRRRVAVLDKIEDFDGLSLILEDAECKALQNAVETFPWSQANRTLINLIDDIAAAKPYPILKEVKDDDKASA